MSRLYGAIPAAIVHDNRGGNRSGGYAARIVSSALAYLSDPIRSARIERCGPPA